MYPLRPRRPRSALAGVLLLASAVSAGGGDGLPEPLRPFDAGYRVMKGALRLGTTTVKLEPNAGGWRYRSVTEADGVFALFVDGKARELAVLGLHEGRLRPHYYRHDEPDDADDVRMDFDWDAAVARVRTRKLDAEVPLAPGAHDQFTVILPVIAAIAGGAERTAIPGIDDEGERVEFLFEVTGQESLEVPLGRFETVRVRRVRDDKRSTVTWLAPELGWLPVAVEQRHKGDLVARMEMEALDGRAAEADSATSNGRVRGER